MTKKLIVPELEVVVHVEKLCATSKKYPCHGQAVEGHVKLVPEASEQKFMQEIMPIKI